MRRSESCSQGVSCSTLIVVLLCSLATGCQKRASVAAPTEVKAPRNAPGPVVRPPELEAVAKPESEGQLWLVWKAEKADFVVIDHGIGKVLPQGRMRIQPAPQTIYIFTAHGPGGATSREVRIGAELDDLSDQYATDHFGIVTICYDFEARLHSYELLAEAYLG